MATFNPVVEFTSSLGYVVVIYFGGVLAFGGSLSVGDLVAFFLYLDMFYQPVRALAGTWEQVQEALAGAERVTELLDVRARGGRTPRRGRPARQGRRSAALRRRLLPL